MNSLKPYKLLYSAREDVVDEEFFGFVYLFDKNKLLSKFGEDFNSPFFLRSLSKPIQASLGVDLGTFDYYNFSDEQKAITCGSHSGTKLHCALVEDILKKAGLTKDELKCPKTAPLDLIDFDGEKTALCNNCSAKHALMLAICKQMGWDIENYCDISHPLQQLIYKKHLKYTHNDNIPVSKDGCSTPVFAMKAAEIANMFFDFFHCEKYKNLFNSVIKFPYEFGGNDRLDSEVITLGKGNLFAKVGAGGFLLVYNFNEDKIFIIKMSQNNNFARRLVVLKVLDELNWIDNNAASYDLVNGFNDIVGKYYCNFSFL